MIRSYFFIILMMIGLGGCHPSSPENLRFGLSTAPINLDPRFATDAVSTRINRLLYRALVDFDEQLRPKPDLATWEQPEPTRYRFYLGQEGRTFHEGSRLNAQDVKATYDFILDDKNISPHRGSLSMIQKIDIINNNVIDFILKKPDPLFPGRLVVGIVPNQLIHRQHPFNKQPVGSGLFRLVQWPSSNHLYLQRMSDQQIVEFLEIKDPVVRVLKLLRKEVDILQGDLSPELVRWLTQRSEVRLSKTQGTDFTYLGFNLQDSLTQQALIRQAITYAINRDEIIHYVLGNAAQAAQSFLLTPSHWAGAPPSSQSYTYDPGKAQTLLAQAGFSEHNPLTLTYKTSNNPFRIRVASVIQQQLAQVGIKVLLRTYDWGTFYGDIKAGRFQMFSLSWVGVKMPDIFHYAFHSDAIPPRGANRGRLKNAQIDTLIEQAEQAPTLEKQAKLYRQLQKLLLDELPYVPLWFEDYVLATTQRVEGYRLAPDGNYDGLKKVTLRKLS